MTLKSKVAAIFAANGAIAREVAIEMAKEGALVYISGRNINEVKLLSKEIIANGYFAKPFQVDATNEKEIELFFKQIIEAEKRIDIVFNGIGLKSKEANYGTPSIEISLEKFLLPLNTILASQFLTARTGAKFMQRTDSKGTILLLSASLSKLKVPFMAGITACCSAVEGLTRVLAAEFGAMGIKVTCLTPTGMPDTKTIKDTNELMMETFQKIGVPVSSDTPTSSLLSMDLTTKHTAKVAVFLASDAGGALNSHVVDIDFGQTNVL